MRKKSELDGIPLEERKWPEFNPPLSLPARQYLRVIDSDLEQLYFPGFYVLSLMPRAMWNDSIAIGQIMDYYREKGGWQVVNFVSHTGLCLEFR